jgi:dCTP deaminase
VILSDRDICKELAAGSLAFEPFIGGNQLQPASIEVRLAFEPRENESIYMLLEPGEFRLAHTFERVRLPAYLAARVEGKSSLGRLGLLIHAAGFIDPGFTGQITLELKNLSNEWIRLSYQQPVGQLAFIRLSSPAERPYGSPELGSHYQGQMGTTPSYLAASAD